MEITTYRQYIIADDKNISQEEIDYVKNIPLKKLKDSRKNILNGMRSTQNRLINSKTFFDKIGYNSNTLRINEPIIDLIKAFTFANAFMYS